MPFSKSTKNFKKSQAKICINQIFYVPLCRLFGDRHILRRINVSAWKVNPEDISATKRDKLNSPPYGVDCFCLFGRGLFRSLPFSK